MGAGGPGATWSWSTTEGGAALKQETDTVGPKHTKQNGTQGAEPWTRELHLFAPMITFVEAIFRFFCGPFTEGESGVEVVY